MNKLEWISVRVTMYMYNDATVRRHLPNAITPIYELAHIALYGVPVYFPVFGFHYAITDTVQLLQDCRAVFTRAMSVFHRNGFKTKRTTPWLPVCRSLVRIAHGHSSTPNISRSLSRSTIRVGGGVGPALKDGGCAWVNARVRLAGG